MWKPSRPSPAMLVAVAALIVSLAGTGYAASLITGKDIKKNSVDANRLKKKTLTGKQVKKNALTGQQIRESRLRTVPSARLARRAEVAARANDAATVGGLELRKFYFHADDGVTDQTVLTIEGLTLKASCEAGSDKGLTVKAVTSAHGAAISQTSISQGGTETPTGRAANNVHPEMVPGTDYLVLSPHTAVQTTNGPNGRGASVGQIVYSERPNDVVVSIDWSWAANRPDDDCTWVGTAIGGGDHPVVHRERSAAADE